MSDVALYHTYDGGEITVSSGVVELSGGIESSTYLSLFGGNIDDPGDRDSLSEWWGNIDETDLSKHQRSRTQHLLRSIPAIPANLKRIEDAARNDLAWMVTQRFATSVEVNVSLTGRNRVQIDVTVVADERVSKVAYSANWRADAS